MVFFCFFRISITLSPSLILVLKMLCWIWNFNLDSKNSTFSRLGQVVTVCKKNDVDFFVLHVKLRVCPHLQDGVCAVE